MRMPSIKPGAHTTSQADDEGSWLVSYADMITLLLGFFVMLYSFSTLENENNTTMQEQITDAFGPKGAKHDVDGAKPTAARQIRALQMLVEMLNLGHDMNSAINHIERASERAAANKESAAQLEHQLSKDAQAGLLAKLKPASRSQEPGTLEIVLPDTALFEAGSAVLRQESVGKVHRLALTLTAIPDVIEIDITGHTDGTPLSGRHTFADNWALSSARAGAVASAFIAAGIDRKKIRVQGMADLEPLYPETDANGRAIPENQTKNRRVHIRVKKAVQL